MYKLLLVDDEEEVRKGILKKIDWNRIGFEIAGEAENGKEALEIAEKTIPDVIITDIRMPFMDGMALAAAVKNRFPTTKIIIVTGFEEFEYAKKAINLNVTEYILKPISSGELIEVLKKVKLEIDGEIARKEDIQALKEHYIRSLPVLREKFLTSLITNKQRSDEIHDKMLNYGLKLEGGSFLAAVISMDSGSLSCQPLVQDKNQLRLSGFNTTEDRELLNFAILNIAEEITDKYGMGLLFLYEDNIVVIASDTGSDRDTIMERSLQAFEELRQSTVKYIGIPVTVGVGTVCHSIAGLSSSYKNALSALDYRMYLGSDRVILIEDVEPKSPYRVVFDELKERALAGCIKVGSIKEIRNTVEGLFREISDTKTYVKDYQVYLIEMLTTIIKAARDSSVDIDKIFGSDCNLFVELYKMNNIQEAKNWITGICSQVMNYISTNRQDTCNLIVKKAREYAREHFHESDVTTNKVCKHLHISNAYFSAIFKKETETTFMNYLSQIRMESAKELLRTTGMKTFEIAEKVGFSEPNYFSYCFKKNLGISPSEYRNSV